MISAPSAALPVARCARCKHGLLQQLLDSERLEVDQAFARAKADVERLFHRFDLEYGHAG